VNALSSTRVHMALDWNRRLMRQPPGAACTRCEIRNPFALVLPMRPGKGGSVKKRPLVCYKCRIQLLGRSGWELHHLGGRPSPVAPVLIDANLHRVLTYLQLGWRREGIAPGSTEATVRDVVALVLVSLQWLTEGK